MINVTTFGARVPQNMPLVKNVKKSKEIVRFKVGHHPDEISGKLYRYIQVQRIRYRTSSVHQDHATWTGLIYSMKTIQRVRECVALFKVYTMVWLEY